MNGKGDATRPCDWKRYRANHDQINWHRSKWRKMTDVERRNWLLKMLKKYKLPPIPHINDPRLPQ